MMRYKLKILILMLFFLSANTSVCAGGCEIAVRQNSKFTVAVGFSQNAEIEGINMTTEFDTELLGSPEATLTGGILEENYSFMTNDDIEGEIRIAAYAADPVSGSGDVVFLSFDVAGKCSDGTTLSFKTLNLPSEGGFHVGDEFCKELEISVIYDSNRDNRLGMEDAIYALQCASGMFQCEEDAGIREALCALQAVSGKSDF